MTWAASASAGARSSQVEGRDVHAGFRQEPSHAADDARLVVVREVEHVGTQLGLHLDALDLHDAGLGAPEKRTGNRTFLRLGLQRDPDQGLVVAVALVLGLRNRDVALPGQHRSVYHVHRVQHRAEHAE